MSHRQKSIAKWIRETQPEAKHFSDLWHVSIAKRLLVAGKEMAVKSSNAGAKESEIIFSGLHNQKNKVSEISSLLNGHP